MHSLSSLLLALFLAGTAGCASHDKVDAPTSEFASLAGKFRAKAGADRRTEGERIQKLLPHCPITWMKDIGTGTLISYDYSRPSYRLTKAELIQALGEPNSTHDYAVWYVLAQETDGMRWGISVDIHDDYVVGSMIIGGLTKDH